MAGTVTVSEETHGTLKKVHFTWTSSAGGAADGSSTGAYNGVLLRAVFVPGTGGDQPTDQYDVVVDDADGHDVLAGQGANRSNAAAETVVSAPVITASVVRGALAVITAGPTAVEYILPTILWQWFQIPESLNARRLRATPRTAATLALHRAEVGAWQASVADIWANTGRTAPTAVVYIAASPRKSLSRTAHSATTI